MPGIHLRVTRFFYLKEKGERRVSLRLTPVLMATLFVLRTLTHCKIKKKRFELRNISGFQQRNRLCDRDRPGHRKEWVFDYLVCPHVVNCFQFCIFDSSSAGKPFGRRPEMDSAIDETTIEIEEVILEMLLGELSGCDRQLA